MPTEPIEWNEDAPVVLDPNEEQAEYYKDANGNTIEMKCRNCSMWKRNIAVCDDKPMCFPGRKITTVVDGVDMSRRMNENLWSCRMYFVPQESAELLQFLPATPDQIWSIRHIGQVLKSLSKFNAEATRRKFQEDVVGYAVEIAKQHYTKNAFDYTLPLLQFIADEAKKKLKLSTQKPRRNRATRYHPGDSLEWTDLKTGQRMSGWFQCVGRKNASITLIVQAEVAAALGYASALVKYPLNEWREKANPQLVSKATIVDNTK